MYTSRGLVVVLRRLQVRGSPTRCEVDVFLPVKVIALHLRCSGNSEKSQPTVPKKWLLCSVKIGVAQSLTTICLLCSVKIGVTHHNSSFNEKLVNFHCHCDRTTLLVFCFASKNISITFASSIKDKKYSDCAELNCEPLNTFFVLPEKNNSITFASSNKDKRYSHFEALCHESLNIFIVLPEKIILLPLQR